MSISEQIDGAREAALRLLTVRERSRSELGRRLRQKGFHGDAVDAVLDRLAETGVQDDHRFAERYASEAAAKGKSARLIQGELRGRGIGSEVAAAAAVTTPEDEEARARDLASTRAPRMTGTPEARARRLHALLMRRGFSGELARRVAAEAAGLSDEALGR